MPIGARLREILASLQDRDGDGRRVAGKGSAVAQPNRHFAEARVEAGDRENRLRLALLEQQRGEERVVHVLAHAEQRHAQLGLRFRQLGALRRAARRDRRIHQRLLRVEVRIVGVVRRSGNRDVRDAHRNRRDRRLVLRLTRYPERWLLVRVDVLEAQGRSPPPPTGIVAGGDRWPRPAARAPTDEPCRAGRTTRIAARRRPRRRTSWRGTRARPMSE